MKDMRFLLIHVSKNWNGRVYAEYPIGPGIVATIAKEQGHWAFVHDMAVDDASITDVLHKYQPDLIGLSFLSTSSKSAFDVIKKITQSYSGLIVAGGIHASLFPEETLKAGVHIVVIGEGENKIKRILELLRNNPTVIPEDITNICGIAVKHKDTIKITPPDLESVDLNALPVIDRNVYDLSKYAHHSLITSRGCPYRCKFCCSWGPGGKKGRMASPARVLKELTYLVEKHGAETVYWADDMFFFNKRDRLQFCNELKTSGLKIKWIAQLRADTIDQELAVAMRDSGCVKVCLGAEAGANSLLKSIDKDITVDEIANGISTAVSSGLRVKTWWIVGLPGAKSITDHLAAFDVIKSVRPHEVAVHNFIPLPGTQYWNNAASYGITLPKTNLLEDIYYYGINNEIGFDYISKKEIDNILECYDKTLLELGYIPTDLATDSTEYIYTTPLQKMTFKV